MEENSASPCDNVADIPKPDYMDIRRRLGKCSDPIETDAEIRKIRAETGVPLVTLKRCVSEMERERRERQQESRRQEKERLKGTQSDHGDTPEWAVSIIRNKDGEIKDCPFNVMQIIGNHPEWKGRFKRNLFSGCVELDGAAMTESQVFGVLVWLGKNQHMAIRSIHTVHAALKKIGDDDSYHPIQVMLDDLPEWDGTPRVDHMFADFLGARQDAYIAYVGRILLCSMIARAYEPGCIMRRMPVLEGPESAGKSTFVHDLGAPWSAEIFSNIDTKQFEENVQGVWVSELPEMASLNKAEKNRIKAIISLRSSRRRETWGLLSENHPRTTVFVGTVNPNQSLSLFDWDDENTRFFPVVVKGYNQDAFYTARPKLFAEAKAIIAKHPNDWWAEPDAVKTHAAEAREHRSAVDPWIDPIEEFIRHRAETTIPELLFDCLKIPAERQTRYEATRVGKILHALGWGIAGKTRTGPQSRTRIYRPA